MTDLPGRTWPTEQGTYLVLDPTSPTDDTVMVSVYDRTGDGPSACLTATQLRAAITDLTARLNLISQPAQHGTNWDGGEF